MISARSNRIGINELLIFENFEIDNNLPKYKSKISGNNITVGTELGGNIILSTPVSGNNFMVSSGNEKITFRQKIANIIAGKKKEEKPKISMSILDFFTNLSSSFNELEIVTDIAIYYENALKQAIDLGQVSLVEKIKDLLIVSKTEAYLIGMNLTKYVTEEQIIEFYKKVGENKNLKLTWIKNFTRIIPEKIYNLKVDIDNKNLFDNYVILHYDPQDNGSKLTKKEIEQKKDPILFGVLKNSRKLYFIADWKDEYCDLTLEDMFKTLQTEVLTINNDSVKSYLSKIK